MSALSNSWMLLPYNHLSSSGSSLKKHHQGFTKLPFSVGNVQLVTFKKTSSIQARYRKWVENRPNCIFKHIFEVDAIKRILSDDERSSGGKAFVGGFVLGGLIIGTLGCIYAPQISKAVAGTDKKELLKKLPNFIYDEEKALEKTRKKLAQKIAELNSAIDGVSSQLKSDDDDDDSIANGVVPDETEALA